MTPTIESVVLKIGEQTINVNDANAIKTLLQTLSNNAATYEGPKLDSPFYIKDMKIYKRHAESGKERLYTHFSYLNQLRYSLARVKGEKPPMGLNQIHLNEILTTMAARHQTPGNKYPYMTEQTKFRNTYSKYKNGATVPKPLLILEYPELFGEFMAEVRRIEKDYEDELYSLLTTYK